MMDKYIDKEKLLQKLSRMIDYCENDNKVNGLTALFQACDAIMDCPTADVQDVRHGRWMYCGKSSGHDHMWQCSECLRMESTKHKSDIKDYPYCHCGAKMDAKE